MREARLKILGPVLTCAVLTLQASCAGKPTIAKQELWQTRLPGYWVTGAPSPFKGDTKPSSLKIDCDGKMEYDLHYPYAFSISDVKSQGAIHKVGENEIEYTNGLGRPTATEFARPQQDEKGCWKVKIFDITFRSSHLIECPQEEKSIGSAFQTLGRHLASAAKGDLKSDPCDIE